VLTCHPVVAAISSFHTVVLLSIDTHTHTVHISLEKYGGYSSFPIVETG
jgi:hypothetical protein